MNQYCRIHMGRLECVSAPIPAEFLKLGGRGFCSTLIAKEVRPTCHPLGAENKLVISPGILAGTTSPCSQRVSVGAKSPLTGGIKEANAGGTFGQKMGRLGLAAIVLEGKPGSDVSNFTLDVQQKDMIQDIFPLLGIPDNLPRMIYCNGKRAQGDQPLNPGDIIAIFSPMFGG